MKSFKEFVKKKGYKLDEITNNGSKKQGSADALTMDAKEFPIEECAPEVMKIHDAFQNPKIKNYFHELQKEQPDEKYFKFGDSSHHHKTAREIASTSREFAKNLKFEGRKLYLIGNAVKDWLKKKIHTPHAMNPEFPCAWCEKTTDWILGTDAHPNEVWVILHKGQQDGIIPKDASINWSDKNTGEIVVKMCAIRHLRKNVKVFIKPFKSSTSTPQDSESRPRFGVNMSDDKANFNKNSDALYFSIDDRKIYDPTMLGISDLHKKDEPEKPKSVK